MNLLVINSNFVQEPRRDKDEIDNGLTETNNSNDLLAGPSNERRNETIIPSIDFSKEEDRLKTYDDNWPHTFVEPCILAKTGLFYLGPYDLVKCHFCNVQIKNWEFGDNEVDEHQRWSPNCPLLKRRRTTNVPLEPISELNQLLPPLSYDICGTTYGFEQLDIRPDSIVESSSSRNLINNIENNNAPITLRQIKHPEFSIEAERLRSFDEWPVSKKQKPSDLSDAGFYYTQCGDRVICYTCGGILKDWEDDNIPWEQHALWFDKCEYLRLVKGQEYIDAVKQKFKELINDGPLMPFEEQQQQQQQNDKTIENVKTISQTIEQHDVNKPCESRLCKICYASEYNTVFVPCGHVIACGKCASSMSTCPMCRKSFDNIMRIFFS